MMAENFQERPAEAQRTVTTVAAGTEPVAVRRAPGRPRDEGVRQRILNATLIELQQYGVQRLTIEAIAATAGAGKATIYRWWAGLPGLLVEALEQQPIAAESEELLEMVARERLAGGLRALVAEAAWIVVGQRMER